MYSAVSFLSISHNLLKSPFLPSTYVKTFLITKWSGSSSSVFLIINPCGNLSSYIERVPLAHVVGGSSNTLLSSLFRSDEHNGRPVAGGRTGEIVVLALDKFHSVRHYPQSRVIYQVPHNILMFITTYY